MRASLLVFLTSILVISCGNHPTPSATTAIRPLTAESQSTGRAKQVQFYIQIIPRSRIQELETHYPVPGLFTYIAPGLSLQDIQDYEIRQQLTNISIIDFQDMTDRTKSENMLVLFGPSLSIEHLQDMQNRFPSNSGFLVYRSPHTPILSLKSTALNDGQIMIISKIEPAL